MQMMQPPINNWVKPQWEDKKKTCAGNKLANRLNVNLYIIYLYIINLYSWSQHSWLRNLRFFVACRVVMFEILKFG